jgi:hypothetical protein
MTEINDIWGTSLIEQKENKLHSIEPEEIFISKKITNNREYFKKVNSINILLCEMPKPNDMILCLCQGKFDYFQILPFLAGKYGVIEECYLSTWTMNDVNVDELIKLIDNQQILKPNLFVGEYLFQREPHVFSKIQNYFNKNKYQFKVFKNHAKIINCKINDNYYVILGSANFTSNPRLENLTINNNKESYDFIKNYLDGIKSYY